MYMYKYVYVQYVYVQYVYVQYVYVQVRICTVCICTVCICTVRICTVCICTVRICTVRICTSTYMYSMYMYSTYMYSTYMYSMYMYSMYMYSMYMYSMYMYSMYMYSMYMYKYVYVQYVYVQYVYVQYVYVQYVYVQVRICTVCICTVCICTVCLVCRVRGNGALVTLSLLMWSIIVSHDQKVLINYHQHDSFSQDKVYYIVIVKVLYKFNHYLFSYSTIAASRDFTYVEDLVEGIISATEYKPQKCSEIYNLARGRSISVSLIVSLLEENLKKTAKIVRVVENSVIVGWAGYEVNRTTCIHTCIWRWFNY